MFAHDMCVSANEMVLYGHHPLLFGNAVPLVGNDIVLLGSDLCLFEKWKISLLDNYMCLVRKLSVSVCLFAFSVLVKEKILSRIAPS